MHRSLIEKVQNIHRRLCFHDEYKGRDDICKYANELIAWQDRRLSLSDINLTFRERAAGRFLAQLIGIRWPLAKK